MLCARTSSTSEATWTKVSQRSIKVSQKSINVSQRSIKSSRKSTKSSQRSIKSSRKSTKSSQRSTEASRRCAASSMPPPPANSRSLTCCSHSPEIQIRTPTSSRRVKDVVLDQVCRGALQGSQRITKTSAQDSVFAQGLDHP